MPHSRLKKIAVAILLFLTILCAGAGAFWYFILQPNLLLEVTYYQHMQRIGDGIIQFNMARKRMPISLEELVAADFLPREGELYYNPMKHFSPEGKILSYLYCEYELEFFPKYVTIAIPKDVYDQGRYSRLPADSRVQTIRDNVRLLERGG